MLKIKSVSSIKLWLKWLRYQWLRSKKCSRIGSLKLVQEQQELVKLVGDMQPKDSMDLWKYFGNEDPAALPEMTTAEFLKVVKRRVRS